MAEHRQGKILTLLFLVYLLSHLLTLSRYPLVHSDEAWLAELTRSMLAQGSVGITENVFSLAPRYPHALRVLYHILQMPFIALSWSVYAARLPSLLAAGALLFALYRLSRNLLPAAPLLPVLLLAADVQFWYASHFGRQEIFILLFLCWALSTVAGRGTGSRQGLVAGILLGTAAGFHPNAFIAALGTGGFLLGRIIAAPAGDRRGLLQALGIMTAVTAAFGLLWIFLSLTMDAGFPAHYAGLGAGQGVARSAAEKILLFPRFFSKLWRGLSGTYYTPDIRLQLTLFAAALLVSLPLLLFPAPRHRLLPLLGLAVGVGAGTLLIGKYSPPSVLFFFLPGHLLLARVLNSLLPGPRFLRGAALLILLPLAVLTSLSVKETFRADYGRFLMSLEDYLPAEGAVLGNLNMAWALGEGRLRDYRDLGFLRETGTTLDEYVEAENIRTLVLTSELDLIYRQRPVWNDLYGNPYYWYRELLRLTEERGTLTGEFAAPWYGMRLFHRIGDNRNLVRVYSLSPAEPGNP
jgi:hypothetical protein